MDNRLVVVKGNRGRGGKDLEFRLNRYKLLDRVDKQGPTV